MGVGGTLEDVEDGGESVYDDGLVRLDAEAITLRRYYFPVGLPKRIPYAHVRAVEVREMTWLSGKARLWGSTLLTTWLPLDARRPRKDVIVVLDVGARVRPAFTPDDPDRVQAILRERTGR